MTALFKFVLRVSAFYCSIASLKASMFFDGMIYSADYFYDDDIESERMNEYSMDSNDSNRIVSTPNEVTIPIPYSNDFREYFSIDEILDSSDDYFFFDIDDSNPIINEKQPSVSHKSASIKNIPKTKEFVESPKMIERFISEGNDIVTSESVDNTHQSSSSKTSKLSWFSTIASTFSPNSVVKSLNPSNLTQMAFDYFDREKEDIYSPKTEEYEEKSYIDYENYDNYGENIYQCFDDV